jgi:diguanylate cyclase (GGDEF)-like protein/PAS domain S-box-containing protein
MQQVAELQAELTKVTLEKNFLQRAMQDLNFHDNAHDGILYTDEHNRIVYANPYFLAMMGIENREELLNQPLPDYMWNDPKEARQLFEDIGKDGFVREREMSLHNQDGQAIFAMCSGVASIGDEGQVIGKELMFCNITSKRMFEAELIEQTALLDALLESTPDPILILNKAMQVERSTPAAQRLVRLQSQDQDDDIYQLLAGIGMDKANVENLHASLEKEENLHQEFELNGRYYDLHAAPLTSSKKGWVCVLHDVTERKRTEERLEYRAYHDILTQLPNRAYFFDKLNHAINAAADDDKDAFAVLFIDLDKLKTVNDSFGHHVGDQFLVEFAHRLEASIRPGDLAGRLGGDEFAVLLARVNNEDAALKITKRMHRSLRKPFKLPGTHVVESKASIGIALYERSMHEAEDVLRSADQAMYRAKQAGGDKFRI